MVGRPNADGTYHRAAAALNQHLKSCSRCIGSLDAMTSDGMCDKGYYLTGETARRFAKAAKSKWWRKAGETEHVYICPDPDAHGKAYTYTMTPVTVVAEHPPIF